MYLGLDIDFETGKLIWAPNPGPGPCGSRCPDGSTLGFNDPIGTKICLRTFAVLHVPRTRGSI